MESAVKFMYSFECGRNLQAESKKALYHDMAL